MRRALHRSIALALSTSLLAAATVSAVVVPPFSDIAGHPFEEHIEWMRQAGLTEGCGGGRYCPDDPVTRGQMASFLARALELPPTSVDAFSDDNGTTHEDAINRLAASGIASGCTATRYCPSATVIRGQMASFLARGLDCCSPPATGSPMTTTPRTRPTSTAWQSRISRAGVAPEPSAPARGSRAARWPRSSTAR